MAEAKEGRGLSPRPKRRRAGPRQPWARPRGRSKPPRRAAPRPCNEPARPRARPRPRPPRKTTEAARKTTRPRAPLAEGEPADAAVVAAVERASSPPTSTREPAQSRSKERPAAAGAGPEIFTVLPAGRSPPSRAMKDWSTRSRRRSTRHDRERAAAPRHGPFRELTTPRRRCKRRTGRCGRCRSVLMTRPRYHNQRGPEPVEARTRP